MGKYFNLAETAKALKISRTTLRKLIALKLIPVEMVGKRFIVSETVVKEFAEQIERNAGIPADIYKKITNQKENE